MTSSPAYRFPVDSAEAAELRERAEARAARDAARVTPPHDSACRDGWLGWDDDERPRPCPSCRPVLFDVRCATCGTRAERCSTELARVGQRCCTACGHASAARRAGDR